MDLDDDSFFPTAASDEDEDEDDKDGDPYADLAAKYNAEPSEEDYE